MQLRQNSYSVKPSIAHCFLTFKRWGTMCVVKAAWPMPLPTLEMNRHMLTAELTS